MNVRRLVVLGVLILLCYPCTATAQSTQLADSLFQRGREYDKSGNIRQSEHYYREAYTLYDQLKDTAALLKVGKQYASAMMWRSKEEKAMKLYEKLLQIDHPSNDAYNRGDIYNSMGVSSRRRGKIDQALNYYKKSLPLALESSNRLLIGIVYGNMGGVYNERGNYAKALEFLEKGLPYFRSLDNKKSIATTLSHMGSVYKELSLFDKALEYYNKSLDIRKQLGNVYSLANIYNQIAITQRNIANYDQALVGYEKSLEFSRRAGTPQLTSQILNNLGVIYRFLGEYDKAYEYYHRSLTMKKKLGNKPTIAATSKNLGKLFWEQGKVEEAKRFYDEALALRSQVGNPYEIASWLNSMVDLAIQEGQLEEAQGYVEEIKAIGDSTGSYEILKDATKYLGTISAEKGNQEQALHYYKKSLDYSKYLAPINQLGPLKRLAGQYHYIHSDSALIYGQKAIDIIEKSRTNVGASSRLKSSYFGRHADLYTRMALWELTYNKNISRAFQLIEQSKARALRDELMKAAQNIQQKLPEKARIKGSQKRQVINDLYLKLQETNDKQLQAKVEREIRRAELNYDAYENELHNKYPQFKSLQSPQPISLYRAQQMMGEQTAVLEYAVANNRLIMFLISQEQVRVEQFSLPENRPLQEQLTGWVADYKDAILANASRSTLKRQSQKLYDALLKPFEKDLNSYSNLIIVPDGALAYLPFEAILRGNRYLIEDFKIKYEPSLTSLRLLKNSDAKSGKELLAVAGSNVSEKNSSLQQRMSALPSTVIEVDSIASNFKEVSTLKNKQVSEAAFKGLLQKNRYQYIHMATHGIIDENQPGRSGLVLSAEGAITPSSKEDGMLRSSEIFGLDIKSDMVVLSACNTGLGKVVKGEGMLGMQRSFFYAGTSTVVVSLWNVYDRSTASLMNEFYDALINGSESQSWIDSMLQWTGWDQSIPFGLKAQAMRKAKLQMINHPLFNHPVYWAPFIVVGR